MTVHLGETRGFSLIASLLLLMMLSGLALGLVMMVTTESHIGGADLENNVAYYAAEAGMEKMTVDLANLYTSNQAPTAVNIAALGQLPPALANVSYPGYALTVATDASGNPIARVDSIHQGPNQGLIAEIVPITLSVTAQRPAGASVSMTRTVEVALIPVFQFGVFSDSDLSYFPGPSFDFQGRVHTNGNLFLDTQSSDGLIFHSKVAAVKEVVRDTLSNGAGATGFGYTGPVYIPNAPNGCDPAQRPSSTCLNLQMTQASVTGGVPGSGTTRANKSWPTISTTTFLSYIVNGQTGARALNLPFTGAGVSAIEIVRRPPAGETSSSTIGQSRLYNEASIRILLADTQPQLHAERAFTDADDVWLVHAAGATYPAGIAVTGVGGTSYFAYANQDCAIGPKWCDPANQVQPFGVAVAQKQWPLLGGWLRVEYMDTSGAWHGATREWLQLGFSRGPQSPVTAGGNAVHPNAILILQQQADRDGSGDITNSSRALAAPYNGIELEAGNTIAGANTQYIWYPINLYDPREGEVRDTAAGKATGTCAVNGIMNAVELDVGNLRRWLRGTVGTSGVNADSTKQNGYVLYFSDRRGMRANPNAQPTPNVLTGEYGFEDTINMASANGTPNGALDPNNPGTTQSPEDVDMNGRPDNWGAYNVGEGFGATTTAATHAAVADPYTQRVGCTSIARKNAVTGARHVLKLVDGVLGNLPARPDGSGGFTVASENPVYVQGNYNANNSGFGNGNADAGVIADAVTLLSNQWNDLNGFLNPLNPGARAANTTWYRMAVAAGKNLSFPQPTSFAAAQDYGTDGGLHNFLRYIESWGGTLNYQGSLVSLYYSQYATGVFKCCTTVYGPPTRAYSFDQSFLAPSNLPPGTPTLLDVNNLSFRQDFTAY